jgi:putative oxidoreductase
MHQFPFINAKQSLTLLRVSTAFIFLAHAIVRVFNGTITQFAEFLNGKGFAFSIGIVWAITAFEIIGSLLLTFGYFTKWLSAAFILMLIIGIVLIHASLGWFVGEHGTGGSEYSFILIIALIVIASNDKNKQITA